MRGYITYNARNLRLRAQFLVFGAFNHTAAQAIDAVVQHGVLPLGDGALFFGKLNMQRGGGFDGFRLRHVDAWSAVDQRLHVPFVDGGRLDRWQDRL